MPVWRVGHCLGPCDFPPTTQRYAWSNRFDDPEHEYRTLYCADEKKTCLREVLADMRPNTKAIAEFKNVFGPGERLSNRLPAQWREKNVLAHAEMEILSGDLAEIESMAIRRSLENRLAKFLHAEGVKRLNIHELRGKNRHITQRLSRELFDEGRAGIKFNSHLDKEVCYALFEFRANLHQLGKAIALTDDIPELAAVCNEFGLTLI